MQLNEIQTVIERSPELLAEPITVSCYAARSNNPNIVISCSAGILWLTPRYANGKLSTSLARKNYTN